MGLLHIYDTVSNKHNCIRANGKLKDILPEIDFSHSLCLKAGDRLDGNYEVQPQDVLYVRKVPGAITATTALIVGAVALVAAGVGVGVAIDANNKSKEAQEKADKAQRNAQNMAAQVQQLPFIRGAKNRSALGEPVQFVMGSVYNTPYNITGGFYSIDGTDGVNSYYNAVFSAGYGNQKITEILLGGERIAHNDNGISGEQDFDSNSLYYNQNNTNKVEVRQAGETVTLTNCNRKVTSTYSGAELKHDFGQDAVPIIVQAGENAMSIQVCIQFSSLRKYNTDAETWEETSATVRPYWSNDGGTTWNEFIFTGTTNNVFTKNANKNIRYVATKNFTALESFGKNILIKVVKESPKAEHNTQEDCCLLWYQTFGYDAVKSSASELVACEPLEPQLYNKTTRIAYRIVADENSQNMLDEVHAMAQGYARTWNGTQWSNSKEPTRNPASWIMEVLTSDIHTPSKYNMNEVDTASFGALYEYCETNGFYCDGILSQSEKKLDIITKILNSCNASLIINQEGKLEVCIDKEETNPVALLNTENIVSFTFSKSLAKKTDGTKVTYTNRNSWAIDTFYSMLDGGSYDYTSDTVDLLALDYVTTYEHAYKMAQRKLRQRQLQPREIKVDVGSEGDWYPLYSTILLQLPHLLQGLNSSVIKKINYNADLQISSIVISDAVQFEEGSYYGVIIQATNDYGCKLYYAEVTGTELTRTLYFRYPLDLGTNTIVPTVGNHLSFGLLDSNREFSKVTHTMKIYGTEPNGKDGYTLTLRDYNEEIYSYGGVIPAYKSNITRPQKGNTPVTLDDVNRLRQDMNVLQEDLMEAYKLLEMPVVVDADVCSVIIETDELGNVVTTQGVETQITVKQGWEDREFSIGSINVPNGWSYEVVGGKVIFTIAEGAVVRSGQFKIPVIYTPVTAYEQYEDENGNTYADENDANYMNLQVASSPYTYDLWFSYFGLTQGVYLGMISNLSNVPTSSNLNDYFVWSGTNNTESPLSSEGAFKQGKVYKFIGPNKAWKWEPDNDVAHSTYVLPDVLGIANADLEHNNSHAWEYLDHLTTNSLYADMLVANQAFIDLVTAGVVQAGSLITVGQVENMIATEDELAQGYASDAQSNAISASQNYSDDLLTAYINDTGISRNYTIIQNGKIVTGLIDTDAIKASTGFFDNIHVAGDSSFSGIIHSEQAVFTSDCEPPILKFYNKYNSYVPVIVNLDTITKENLKTLLDNIINSDLGIPVDWTDTTYRRVYINISSQDGRYIGGTKNYTYMYLERYKVQQSAYEDYGTVYYVIGDGEQTYIESQKRILLKVDANNITKYTSSTYSNVLKFGYILDHMTVNTAETYFAGLLKSKLGYRFTEPDRMENQSVAYGFSSGSMYNLCSMLQIGGPRLCCVQRGASGKYELGIVYKSGSEYIVNIAGVTFLEFVQDSSALTGLNNFLI